MTLAELAKAQGLANIYSFIGQTGREKLDENYTGPSGEAGMTTGVDPKLWTSYGGEQNEGKYTDWLDRNNIKYSYAQDYSGGEAGMGGGDDSTTKRLVIDWNSVPKTKFGDVKETVPLTYLSGDPIKDRKVINERYVYDDPNYGKITHAANVKDAGSWMDYLPMAIMAASTMGLGALGMPALASALVSAGRSYGQGGGLSSLASLGAKAAGSYLGVPDWATSAGTTLAKLAQGGKP